MPHSAHKTVLMADDDAEDCMLATEAFAECGAEGTFSCVSDGMELMDYLRTPHLAERGVPGLPNLILLDLNMPRKDGREALIEIKSETHPSEHPYRDFNYIRRAKGHRLHYESGCKVIHYKTGHFRSLG